MSLIRLLEQTTPGTPPTDRGFLYVDSADSLIKFKNDDGTVFDLTGTAFDTFLELLDVDPTTYVGQAGKNVSVNSGETGLEFSTPGVGDVVGPVSATNNAIVRFDATTGRVIQNSGIIIDDEDNFGSNLIPDSNDTRDLGSGSNRWRNLHVSSISFLAGTTIIGDQLIETSAVLGVHSTTQGFLKPQMTNTQRDAISTPVSGLEIYSTTDDHPEVFDGSDWRAAILGSTTPVTDNSIITFNGTTGRLIQSSVVTIDDVTGLISGSDGLIKSGTVTIRSSASNLVLDGSLGVDVELDDINSLSINKTFGNDIAPMIVVDQAGTNPGQFHLHVGDRDPRGVLTARTNTLYAKEDGINSALFYNTSPTTGTKWDKILTEQFEFGAFGRLENHIRYSEEMDNAVWVAVNATVTPNDAIAPNGELTADTVAMTTAGIALRQDNLGLTASTLYTLSFWARFVSGTFSNLGFDLGDGTAFIFADGEIDSTLRRYSIELTSGANDWLDISKFASDGTFELWGFSIQLGSVDEPYVKTTNTQITTPLAGAVVNDNLIVNGNAVSTQGSTVFDIFSNDDWSTAITAPDGELRVPLVLGAVYFIHNDLVLPKMLLPEGTDPLAFQFTTFKGAKGVTNLFIDGDMTGHFWGRNCQGMRLFDIAFTDIGNSFAGFSTKLYNLVGLGGATSLLYMERCAFFQFKQEGQLVDIGLVQVGVQDGFNDSGWTVRSTAAAAAAGLVNSIINSGGINISAFPDTKHPVFSFIGVIADFAVTHYGVALGKAANSEFYFDQALSGGVYGLTAFSYGGSTTHGEFFRPDLSLSITAQANADIVINDFANSEVSPGDHTTVHFDITVDFTRGQTVLIADEAAYNGLHEIVRVAANQMSFDIAVPHSTSSGGTLKMVEHTVAANKLTRDETVTISGTTSYNATAQVLRETDTTFHLPQAFVANDAIGTATSVSLDETSNSLQVAVAGAQKSSTTSAEIILPTNSQVTVIDAVDALVRPQTDPWTSDVLERMFLVLATGESIYSGKNPKTLKLDGAITFEPTTATKELQATFFIEDSTRRVVTFDNTTDTILETATPRENGDTITFNNSDGTLPAEIDEHVVYFVVQKTTNSFKIWYDTVGGTVPFSDDGSGTNSYAIGEVHGSTPTLSLTASNPGTVSPQALATVKTNDIIYPIISNKSDAVNINVTKAYYRVSE